MCYECEHVSTALFFKLKNLAWYSEIWVDRYQRNQHTVEKPEG